MNFKQHIALTMAYFIFIAGGWLPMPTALAASFDCGKATTDIEHKICNDNMLSRLDEELAEVYRIALKNASDANALKARQRQWLNEVRQCKAEECLVGQYRLRLSILRDGNGAIEYVKAPTPLIFASFEDAQRVLELQNWDLKNRQKTARGVLYFIVSNSLDTPGDKTGYCQRFWGAVESQNSFDIPKPELFAASTAEKKALFDAVYEHALNNFHRYIEQNGQLSPDSFTDVEGDTIPFGLSPKFRSSHIKELPEKFNTIWNANKATQGFRYNYGFITHELIDDSIAVRLLYLTPHPVPHYVRPLILTLGKDQCMPCTGGLSLGINTVGVDGLPGPGTGAYLSMVAYREALRRYEADRQHSFLPDKPVLRSGVGVFAGEWIFWTLEEQIWVGLSPNIELFVDPKEYTRNFRRYVVTVYPLSEPHSGGPSPVCSVHFN